MRSLLEKIIRLIEILNHCHHHIPSPLFPPLINAAKSGQVSHVLNLSLSQLVALVLINYWFLYRIFNKQLLKK